MIKLKSNYEGSSYTSWGIELNSLVGNVETPVDFTGANVLMNLILDGAIYRKYSTEDGTLTVSGNKIIVPAGTVNLAAGLYSFDFNVIFDSGKTLTGLAQGQWEILTPKTIR